MPRVSIIFPFLVLGWAVCLSRQASAQGGLFTGMQAGVESGFSSVKTTVTFASGAVTKTTTTSVAPSLTLNMNTMLYPALRLSLGGNFDLNAVSNRVGELTTQSTLTRRRPYFLLRSTNPVLSPGIGYFRREAVDRGQGRPDAKLVNDEYAAYLGWKPAGLPHSDVQVLKTHTFDGQRAFQDITKNFGSVISQFRYQSLGLYYRGTYLKTDDHIRSLETRQVSQAVRGDFSQTFIRKRLTWNTSYNINRQEFRTVAHDAGGEVALPVTPFAGLASVSDTPVTATLSSSAPLIDGNLTAAAGINLGLPATPLDAQLRNIGLDLLTPMEVNRLWLWVDRELPMEVANAFSWDIYSSPDNITWKRESTVGVAPFGAFENHFEIDFPAVTARYIKVVTRPLSAVVRDASLFDNILVTELAAFVTQSAAQVAASVRRDNYLFNTDARMRILDVPTLYYEGSYLANGINAFTPTTDTWSNGLAMNHAFSRVVSTYARVAREQGRQVQGERVATLSSGTLTIEPIPTFRSSILYSGQDERIAGEPSRRRGLFVQNSARPYRGIDMLFGFGWTSSTSTTGEISHGRLLNVSATVVPREHVNFTLNFDTTTTDRSGMFSGTPTSVVRRSYAALVLDPLRTLHLLVGGELIATTGQTTRSALNLGASWAPFPDGTLQFTFAYNEALRPLEFGKDRSTVGAMRWNVSRRSFLDVSYQKTRNANDLVTTESSIFSVRVRVFL